MDKVTAGFFDHETNIAKTATVPEPKVRIFSSGEFSIRVTVKWAETSWGNKTHERKVFLDFSDGCDPLGNPYWRPIVPDTLNTFAKRELIGLLCRICDEAVGTPDLDLEWREEDADEDVLMGP